MNDGFLEEAVDVCGKTWNIAMQIKIWWWERGKRGLSEGESAGKKDRSKVVIWGRKY